MSFDISTLVTDRTAADVSAINDKGTYNASDLNRVGAAMAYLADRFAAQGYAVYVSPKTDWTAEDVMSASDVSKYLDDLAALRAAFTVLSTTPSVPEDMSGLTYQEANDIEKILEDIDRLLTNAAQAWFYSGDVYSGEV